MTHRPGTPGPGWACWVFTYHNCQMEWMDGRIELWSRNTVDTGRVGGTVLPVYWWLRNHSGHGPHPNGLDTAIVFGSRRSINQSEPLRTIPHGSWKPLQSPQPGFRMCFDFAGREAYQARHSKTTTVWHLSYTHPLRVNRGFGHPGTDYAGREIYMQFLHGRIYDEHDFRHDDVQPSAFDTMMTEPGPAIPMPPPEPEEQQDHEHPERKRSKITFEICE